jgi:hypothetical protein
MLPLLTVLATLTAAGVAAGTALLVAWMNTRSARRLALESAHRQYRQDLTSQNIAAHREFVERFRRMYTDLLKARGGTATLITAFMETSRELGREYVSAVTGDDTFDRATRVAADSRLKASNGLLVSGDPSSHTSPQESEDWIRFMLDWLKRLDRAAAAMQTSAEGFVFESNSARRIALTILDSIERELDSITWFGGPKV